MKDLQLSFAAAVGNDFTYHLFHRCFCWHHVVPWIVRIGVGAQVVFECVSKGDFEFGSDVDFADPESDCAFNILRGQAGSAM